jgi:4-hydroxybenzoate polyprenyltransferase
MNGSTPNRFAAWLRAIRVQQWVKNLLVFVPALVSHRITEPGVLLASTAAFLAFNLCASSAYVFNDLVDIAADRAHPRKRHRPFAAGVLSASQGVWVALTLLAGAAAIATLTGLRFSATLALYYVMTWLYSVRLKRAALVDVMTLAGLYTLRIVAGAAAASIVPSFWLLAFSIFIFLSLGIIKRYAELYEARQSGLPGGEGRGYSSKDLELLLMMGIAAGFCAVVVAAMYINSPESQYLYRHKEPIWLICPLLLYWIMRMWLLATRGHMNDDPLVFALRDRISIATLVLVGALGLVSI